MSYFIGKSHFEEDDTQNYLVFQPINRYFKMIANSDYVSRWKSTRVKFTGSCLEQPKNSYAHGKIVNIYIVYTLGASSSNTNHPTLKNCFLVQLLWVKTLILISTGVWVKELDLIEKTLLHFHVLDLVEM